MNKQFGSLDKPVTVTISGVAGSGKAVLAAFITKQLEEQGATVDFDIHTDNLKIKEAKDAFWEDTKKFVNENGITLTGKPIHVVIE